MSCAASSSATVSAVWCGERRLGAVGRERDVVRRAQHETRAASDATVAFDAHEPGREVELAADAVGVVSGRAVLDDGAVDVGGHRERAEHVDRHALLERGRRRGHDAVTVVQHDAFRREQVADGAGAGDDRARLAVDGDGDVAARVGAAEHLRDDADERRAAGHDERGHDEPAAESQRPPVVDDGRPVRTQLRVRLGHGQRRELGIGRIVVGLGLDESRRRVGDGRGRAGPVRVVGTATGAGANTEIAGAVRAAGGSGSAGASDGLGACGRRGSGVDLGLDAAGQHAGEEGVLVLRRAPEVGLELGELTVQVDRALFDLEQLELAGEVQGCELRGEVDRQPRVRLGRLLARRRRPDRTQRIAPRPVVDTHEPRVAASQMLADRVRLPVRRPHSAAAS